MILPLRKIQLLQFYQILAYDNYKIRFPRSDYNIISFEVEVEEVDEDIKTEEIVEYEDFQVSSIITKSRGEQQSIINKNIYLNSLLKLMGH